MFLKKKNNHLAKIYKFKCFKLEYNNIAAKYSELCHEKPFTYSYYLPLTAEGSQNPKKWKTHASIKAYYKYILSFWNYFLLMFCNNMLSEAAD